MEKYVERRIRRFNLKKQKGRAMIEKINLDKMTLDYLNNKVKEQQITINKLQSDKIKLEDKEIELVRELVEIRASINIILNKQINK